MQRKQDSFSPLNGEIILKVKSGALDFLDNRFQSPQWGNNSKEETKEFSGARFKTGVSVPSMGK